MQSQVQIITGSMLGATEYVAEHIQSLLEQESIPSKLHLQPDISEIPLQGTWIICSSTHGAGDLPDNIQAFAKALPDVDLNQVRFIVIALGDSSYDTFCVAGKTLYDLMQRSNASPLAEIFCIDVLEHPIPEDVAGDWFATLLKDGLLESN